ncbi:MAG: hypothetical protein RQ748_13130, partial [Elusimicrobiales bacterium]|nr:hypothetical protein [Elusimicrobiales bacterium]
MAILEDLRDSWEMDVRGFYLRGIWEADAKTLAFGHPTVPERRLYPSAHNYYLDLMYNFGAFTLLPVLALLIFTVRLAWKSRAAIALSPPLAGLVLVVFYFLVIENSFKVAMRQPYSGIYVFFLWGLLVSYLRAARAAGTGYPPDTGPWSLETKPEDPACGRKRGAIMRIAILNLTGGGISGGHRKYLAGMMLRIGAFNKGGAVLCASPAGIDVRSLLPGETEVRFAPCEPFRPFRHRPDAELKAALKAMTQVKTLRNTYKDFFVWLGQPELLKPAKNS